MCKVFMIPGIKKDKLAETQRLLKEATKLMAKVPDDDGVGYAAITNTGEIYGEKWLKPNDAWNIYKNPEPPQPTLAEKFLDVNFRDVLDKFDIKHEAEHIYDRIGQKTAENLTNTVAVILHTRKSTYGNVSMQNTHPFCIIDDEHIHDTALIHNGSIENHEKLTKKMSTCDSEVILHEYTEQVVNYVPENIKNLAQTLKGVYAVGVLSSFYDEDTETNIPYLDIFKSNKDLYCGYIYELETVVFATTKDILEQSCKETKMTLSKVFEVKDGFLIRIDAITGTLLEGPFEFTLSDRFERYTPPYNNINKPKETEKVINLPSAKTVEDVKSKFEKNHPQLFDDYYEVKDMSEKEKELLEELGKHNNPNLRALYLVRKAVGLNN